MRAVDRVLAVARTAGGVVVGERMPDPVESGSRTAIVCDPDGVRVQIVEGDRTRIACVVVACTDLDSAFGYYRDVMGLRPEDVPAAIDGSMRDARLTDPRSAVAVHLVHSRGHDRARRRAANDLGLFRMAWSTDDCARDEAIVRAAGSVPFAPTGRLSVGDDLPLLEVLFWPGPSGECLELIEATSESGRLSA